MPGSESLRTKCFPSPGGGRGKAGDYVTALWVPVTACCVAPDKQPHCSVCRRVSTGKLTSMGPAGMNVRA